MAGKTKAQIDFEVNTNQFNNSIKEMNTDIKTLTNQLKLNATQLKGNSDNVDLLKERQSLLSVELQKSTQKIDDTNKMLEQAKIYFGENSMKVNDLNNALIKAKTQEAAIKNELANVEKQVENVTHSFDELETSIDNSGESFTIMKGALADLTSSGIQSAISGIGNLVSSLYNTVEETEEYRSMMGKLEGATATFGYSMDFTSQKFDTFYSYLADNQMATNAITNLMGLQTSQESLTNLTSAAISVWSAYGDSIPIESLTESINETAQVGKITGTLADALNWAGISEDEFNKTLEICNSTQERADLIAQTLNARYGESKKSYDELNGSIINANATQNEFQKSQSEVAETLTPLKDKFTELKTQGLETITPVLTPIVDGLISISNWSMEHQGTLETMGIILGSLAISFGLVKGAVALYNVVMPIYTAVTTGASLSTTALGGAIALLTSPITIAVAAIAAVIAIGVLLWKNWDTLKEKAGQLKDNITGKFNSLKEKVVSIFTGIADKAKSVFKFNIDLPKVKLPHFGISPKGWKIGDLLEGEIPKLNVEWYAKGGIFKKPTIFNTSSGAKGVAEAGAEAVLPLDVLDKKLKNSMVDVLTSIRLDSNELDFDKIISNNVPNFNNTIVNSNQINLDRIYELLEMIASKDLSLYVDSNQLASATANADDIVAGEIIKLRERGLEL